MISMSENLRVRSGEKAAAVRGPRESSNTSGATDIVDWVRGGFDESSERNLGGLAVNSKQCKKRGLSQEVT